MYAKNPEQYHLGSTASLVERAIQHGKDNARALSLEIVALKGERDRLVARNRDLIKELDVYKRAHRGDI